MFRRNTCETRAAADTPSGALVLIFCCTLAVTSLAPGQVIPRVYPGNFTARNITVGGAAPNQTAFFSAHDDFSGVEGWMLTASAASPRLMADIVTGTRGSFPEEFAPIDHQRVFFTARASVNQITRFEDRELYFFDASGGGAGVLRSFPIRPGPVGSIPLDLTVVGSRVFFSADDGVFGRELWVSDASGPVRVSDINTSGSSFPHNLVALNSTTVVFAATDDAGDTELYSSNGGPPTLLEINPDPGGGVVASSFPGEMVLFQGRVYFAATRTDAVANQGRELWVTDGTTTQMVMGSTGGLRPGPASSAPDQLVPGIPSAGSFPSLGFTALDAALGRTLWLYFPPPFDFAAPVSSVLPIPPIPNGHTIDNLVLAPFGPLSDAWWFTYEDPTAGNEIGYVAIGPGTVGSGMFDIQTPRGASSPNLGSFPASLQPLPDGVLFRANDGMVGHEVFKIDSSTGLNPRLVMDIKPGLGPPNAAGMLEPKSSFASRFVEFNSSPGTRSYLFAAEGASLRRGLWQTNGSATNMIMTALQQPVCNLHAAVDESVPGMPRLTWALTDVATGSLAFFGFGTQTTTKPVVVPGVQGALLVNPTLPVTVLPVLMTSGVSVSIPLPTFTTPVVGAQVFCMTPGGLASFSGVDPCKLTVGTATLPSGAMADSCGCFDDETGEYNINLKRTDGVAVTTYHALVYTRPSGEQQLIESFSLELGEEIDIQGFVDLFPADDQGDTSGTKSVDLWMLVEPYTPQSTVPPPAGTNPPCTSFGCIVWSSYC